jgi:orotidine-5'-phosphate decarboxylase
MPMFADRLIASVRELGPLCVGLDPHPDKLPAIFGVPSIGTLALWSEAVISHAAGRVAAVKPQSAFYEYWGPPGMVVLERTCKAARKAGLEVILDAKRGDIGSTAEAYAMALIGPEAAYPSDCLTVNPYMGMDTLEPFIARAQITGSGIAVLTRTSNPGSADFQTLKADGQPVYAHVAKALASPIRRLMGESGWSGCMLVAGATGPEEARALRALAPQALFLVPGYGSQGAGAKEAVAGFVPGPNGLEGGLVNASRSVTFASGAVHAQNAMDWDLAIIEAIETAQWDLMRACATGRTQ